MFDQIGKAHHLGYIWQVGKILCLKIMTGICQMLAIHLQKESTPPQCAKGPGLVLRRRGDGSQPQSCLCVIVWCSLPGRSQPFAFHPCLGEATVTQEYIGGDHLYLEVYKCGERKCKMKPENLPSDRAVCSVSPLSGVLIKSEVCNHFPLMFLSN